MKYLIKCHYCGTTYTVDCGEDDVTFMCESCGGQNNVKDVVERIEEIPEEVRERAKDIIRKEKWQDTWKEEETLETIKAFDISAHPASDEYTEGLLEHTDDKALKAKLIFNTIIIVCIVLAYIMMWVVIGSN